MLAPTIIRKIKRRRFKEYLEEDAEGSHVTDCNEFDSLKMMIKREHVYDFDKKRFAKHKPREIWSELEQEYVLDGKESYKTRRVSEEIRGLKSIHIYENKVMIEFSSKIFGGNWRELINKHNFVRALEIICGTGIIELNYYGVLYEGEFSKIDVTKNVWMGSQGKVLSTIQFMKTFAHTRFWNSLTKKTNSVTYSRANSKSTKKESLLLYNKMYNNNLKTKGDPINRKYIYDNNLEEEYAGDLRWECSLDHKDRIVERLGVKDRKIISVLNSTQCPIIEMFNDIVSGTEGRIKKGIKAQFCKSNYAKMKLGKQLKHLGADKLIEMYDGNLDAIRNHLKIGNAPGNVSLFIKNYVKPKLEGGKTSEEKNQKIDYSVENRIKTLRALLKAG